MINDFNEIKNEKDREIYVRCRQILDIWFLSSQNEHKTKDHCLNDCWTREQNVLKDILYQIVKKQTITEEQLSSRIIEFEDNLIEILQYLIVLEDYVNKHGVKH